VFALGAMLFALNFPIEAQQPKKIPKICYPGNILARISPLTPLRERLRELGYIEGKNLTIESRYYKGQIDRLPTVVAELVSLDCDVIFTAGNEAAEAAKNATRTIPIVISNTSDAVRSGFIASLARPGGNVTGLTSVGSEIRGKQVEVLKEVLPRLSRLGFVSTRLNPIAPESLQAVESAAQILRIAIERLEANEPDEIEVAFQTARKKQAEAILMDGGAFFAFNERRLLQAAVNSRLPTMHPNARFVEAGGLMTYTHDRNAQYRRAAEYVDKILKGAKPADLPVERPTKFELVINLKTAKQIGLIIPQRVLLKADRVIR
jgi:putative ABC transport system substrate-binding protein